MKRNIPLLLILLVFLAACTARAALPTTSLSTATPSVTPIPSATPGLEEVMAALSANSNEVQHPTLAPPVHAEPLRFSFPPPAPPPVSLWRPPLYEIPFALSPYDHFYFKRPIAADQVNWPLADYRYGGTFPGTSIIHTGVDIDAPTGTPVLAAAPGKVVWAGYGLYSGSNNAKDPYGLAVTIRHNFGYKGDRLYTVYAHMDRIDVVTGQLVDIGAQLGIVGTTGNTTGPHLHFEVRRENNKFLRTYNPELWLSPPQGWGVLVGQLRNTNGSFLDSQDIEVRESFGRRTWVVRSYGPTVVNRDEYYQENLVLSDLPAGEYIIKISYFEKEYEQDVTIRPGAVTYFTFRGADGFTMLPLPTPSPKSWLK